MPQPPTGHLRVGLAFTSLVLGVLVWTWALFGFPTRLWFLDSFVTGAWALGYLAVPAAAVVSGHMARRRARRSPERYGGRGIALAGLILAYSGFVVWWSLVPLARFEDCHHNVKSLAQACLMYGSDNNMHFPPDFATLFRLHYTDAPQFYICPSSSSTPVSSAEELTDPAHCDYLYFGGGWTEREMGAHVVLIAERAGNHLGFRNVAFGDSYVESPWAWPGTDIRTLARKHGWKLPEHGPDLLRSEPQGAEGARRN